MAGEHTPGLDTACGVCYNGVERRTPCQSMNAKSAVGTEKSGRARAACDVMRNVVGGGDSITPTRRASKSGEENTASAQNAEKNTTSGDAVNTSPLAPQQCENDAFCGFVPETSRDCSLSRYTRGHADCASTVGLPFGPVSVPLNREGLTMCSHGKRAVSTPPQTSSSVVGHVMSEKVSSTPGPWHVETSFIRRKGSYEEACDVVRLTGDNMHPREVIAWNCAPANACLIAAAPELLAALRGIVAQIQVLNAQGAFAGDLEAARAAIALAEGRDK